MTTLDDNQSTLGQPPGLWPKQGPGTRIEKTPPVEYRLAKKEDGSVCLVGAFEWYGVDENGNACGGVDWRELPMMELPNPAFGRDGYAAPECRVRRF